MVILPIFYNAFKRIEVTLYMLIIVFLVLKISIVLNFYFLSSKYLGLVVQYPRSNTKQCSAMFVLYFTSVEIQFGRGAR